MKTNRKKLLPLAVLTAVIAVLCLLLVWLTNAQGTEGTEAILLCPYTADELDGLSYESGDTAVALVKDSDGIWTADGDPTLPLDQTEVQSLLAQYTALTAARQLEEDELANLPERTDTPKMMFTFTAGDSEITFTADSLNEVAEVYYVYGSDDSTYTVAEDDLVGLCQTLRALYDPQTLTDKALEDVTALQVNELSFTYADEVWTLADDADYPLDQDAVNKMASTILELQTDWTITAPDADSAYGLDTPDVTAVLTFSDGSALTVRLGTLTPEDDSLCYLASSTAPTVVYEVSADHKTAFAVTKATLYDAESAAQTAESAAEGDSEG